jgi:gliding motility-associated-like protein
MKIFLRSLALLLVIFFSDQVSAQSFLPYIQSPFGLDGLGAWTRPAFADLDNDGDMDMLASSNYGSNGATLIYYQNTGTAQSPSYAAGIADYLGADYIGGILTPTFVDLDNDGDMDVMVGVQGGSSYYYKNNGTRSAPFFAAPVTNPFGLYGVGYLSCHTFADMDNDGDLDVLIGEYYGNFFYFENTGTVQAPAFTPGPNFPFGLVNIGNAPSPVLKDMDGDGKIDLLVGTESGDLVYFRNIGTTTSPQFSPPQANSFGLSNVGFPYASPGVVDLDADGDLDVFVGANTRDFMYFESQLAPSIPVLAAGSDSGLSPTDNITNVTTPTFTGTAQIGSTVFIYDGLTLLGSVLVTDGTWSVTSSSLTAGTHYITSKAQNAAGNYSGGTQGLSLQVLTGPPTLQITSNLSVLKKGETATITFTFSADPGTSFAWNGAIGDILVTGGSLGNISGTGLTRTATFTPLAETDFGLVVLNVPVGRYSDLAGNNSIAEASGSLTYDTKAPALSSVNISSDNAVSTLAAIGNTVSLTFTSSESIQNTVVTIAGNPATLAATGNNWTATYTLRNGDPSGLITYNIVFGDVAGNQGTAVTTGTGSVTVDSSAPEEPEGLVATAGNAQIVLNWTANSEADLDKYRIFYGTTPAPTDFLADVAAGTTTYTHTMLNNGITYYYRIVAIDQAGNISPESAEVTGVPKGNQTITFNAIGAKTYGDIAFSLGDANSSAGLAVTYTAVDPSVVSITGNMATILKTGNTVITASQAGNVAVNAAGPVQQTLTVAKKILTINAIDQTKAYGTAVTYAGTEFRTTGLVNEDVVTGVVLTSSGASATATVAGGPYAIVPSSAAGTGLDNYTINYMNAALTVGRKALTISTVDQTKTYGTAVTYTGTEFRATGLLNDDVVTSVVLTSLGVSATATVAGGPYAIVPSSAAGTGLDNYEIAYLNSALTVERKALVVLNTDRSKVYGSALAAGDFVGTVTGIQNMDNITLTRASTGAVATAGAGANYPIVATLTDQNGELSNYTITNSDGVLKVTQKALTISAIDQTKAYGTAITYAGTEFSTTGLTNDDKVTGIVLTSTGASATATVAGGPYAIVPSSAAGTGLNNYEITYLNKALTVGRSTLVVLNTDRSKVYGSVLTEAGLEGTVTGIQNNDKITLTRNSAGTIATAGAGTNYPIIATLADQNGELANYNITNPNGVLSVTKKVLSVTAVDKQKFAGTANPELTFGFSGFVNSEGPLVLTTQPAISTIAVNNSPIGDYPIIVTGAAALNYSFSYVNGTLKVKAGAPTNITFAGISLYENSVSGTKAGALSSTSDDPLASFAYTLVAGAGDADNNLFTINGNQLNTSASLDFENKAVYKIRVRATTQNNLWLEKELNVNLTDVNEVPTLTAIANQNICFTTAVQSVALTGITAGPETAQTTTLSVSSSNASLFESLAVNGNGATASLTYKMKAAGTATVTVVVKDNGGTENGGVDSYSKTFVITINALPVIAISSDKGLTMSKGETAVLAATGGVNYTWTANNSIISGLNTAMLTVRPRETTTYTVTASNAGGCSQTQTFTLTVAEDFAKVKATNIMSPNGDGINDKWVIDNIDFYPNNEVKIFDRAGRLMYSKKGYDNSWEGTLNGESLAEGTYYYIIDFGTATPVKKGFITMIRTN